MNTNPLDAPSSTKSGIPCIAPVRRAVGVIAKADSGRLCRLLTVYAQLVFFSLSLAFSFSFPYYILFFLLLVSMYLVIHFI